ncbi:MAG TPA: hypothetical protein PKD90_10435 [Phnomibacter sp.]|nr:hypothetical protein [Phnomibacter sp.]
MKQLTMATLLSFAFLKMVQGQVRISLTADSLTMADGIEFGYRIIEEDTRTAGNEELSRYRIRVVARNTGCLKHFRYRETGSAQSRQNLICTFTVLNATGRRLTTRDASLNAREWWIPVQVEEKNSEGKTVTRARDMMAGWAFRPGENLENTITVLVPKGERPRVEVLTYRTQDW